MEAEEQGGSINSKIQERRICDARTNIAILGGKKQNQAIDAIGLKLFADDV